MSLSVEFKPINCASIFFSMHLRIFTEIFNDCLTAVMEHCERLCLCSSKSRYVQTEKRLCMAPEEWECGTKERFMYRFQIFKSIV